jgi:hypothetical protein
MTPFAQFRRTVLICLCAAGPACTDRLHRHSIMQDNVQNRTEPTVTLIGRIVADGANKSLPVIQPTDGKRFPIFLTRPGQFRLDDYVTLRGQVTLNDPGSIDRLWPATTRKPESGAPEEFPPPLIPQVFGANLVKVECFILREVISQRKP